MQILKITIRYITNDNAPRHAATSKSINLYGVDYTNSEELMPIVKRIGDGMLANLELTRRMKAADASVNFTLSQVIADGYSPL